MFQMYVSNATECLDPDVRRYACSLPYFPLNKSNFQMGLTVLLRNRGADRGLKKEGSLER